LSQHFRILFACLVGAASCLPAFADDRPVAPRDIAAIKQERCEMAGTNLEMTRCMHRELEDSDARLNLVYGTLIKALAKPQALQQAQRTWIAFRDAECRFQNEAMQGGSVYRFSNDLCLMQLTEQRIEVLERVQPCNGCVEFRSEFYGSKGYRLPPRAGLAKPRRD
jgi:uncharacterized protein YecT (DUF1311 family)